MFTDNKDFYPTPKSLIRKMIEKIPKQFWESANYFLDGQAGAGHIIEYLDEYFGDYSVYIPDHIHAIEKDERLAAILRGKNITVVDQDFLTFSGADKYDIILGNPPFSSDEHHLLKAIDIMYSGYIVYTINAETLKNPYTTPRKQLLRKLTVLNADIEYLTSPFMIAERRTDIDIALVTIHIDRKVEADLFGGTTEAERIKVDPIEGCKELTEKDSIKNIVADFDRTVKFGTETMVEFYKNHHRIGGFLKLHVVGEKEDDFHKSLTDMLKQSLNLFLKSVRKDYWRRILKFENIDKKMTVKKREEFNVLLQKNDFMDFTESNIMTFILNLANSYDDILTEATVDIFNKLTVKHAWDENFHFSNVHYYDGWKTNKAYFVNKKVVVPYWNSPFYDNLFSRWAVDYRVKEELNDIDKVMNSFDGASEYTSIVDALTKAFETGQTRNVESTYFIVTVYKKGTIHLTFRSEDTRRRFNITACKGKSWLPHDYGSKQYSELSSEEKKQVEEFEGKDSYKKNFSKNPRLFKSKQLLQIGHESIDQAA